MTFYFSLIAAFFFSTVAAAHPCDAINVNDKSEIISKVEFQGPSNPFWTYVSTDPSTWQFLIERPTVTTGSLEIQVKSTRSDIEYAGDFTNDLHFVAGPIGQFEGKTQKAVLSKMTEELKRFREKNPDAIPRGQWLLVQFATPKGVPLYTCRVGYGTNRLRLTLFAKDGVTRLHHREVELNLAEPVISQNKVEVRTDDGGTIDIKGLPIGMMSVAAGTAAATAVTTASHAGGASSSKGGAMPIIAYFNHFDQTCNLVVEEHDGVLKTKSNDCAQAHK